MARHGFCGRARHHRTCVAFPFARPEKELKTKRAKQRSSCWSFRPLTLRTDRCFSQTQEGKRHKQTTGSSRTRKMKARSLSCCYLPPVPFRSRCPEQKKGNMQKTRVDTRHDCGVCNSFWSFLSPRNFATAWSSGCLSRRHHRQRVRLECSREKVVLCSRDKGGPCDGRSRVSAREKPAGAFENSRFAAAPERTSIGRVAIVSQSTGVSVGKARRWTGRVRGLNSPVVKVAIAFEHRVRQVARVRQFTSVPRIVLLARVDQNVGNTLARV